MRSRSQAIAIANDGTRVSGAPATTSRAAYVAGRRAARGWRSRSQEFTYEYGDSSATSSAEAADVGPRRTESYGAGHRRRLVRGRVRHGDQLRSGRRHRAGCGPSISKLARRRRDRSTSGCEAADFAGMPRGSIVLLQRGTCKFAVKVANAAGRRRGGAIIFDEGNPAARARFASVGSTRRAPVTRRSRSLTTPFALGVELAERGRERLDRQVAPACKVEWFVGDLRDQQRDRRDEGRRRGQRRSWSARTSTASAPGRASTTTAPARPAILEIAEELEEAASSSNKLRFVWFGAEESGLLGSEYYVDEPAAEERRGDRGDAELRHDRLTELRALRLRRRPVGLGRRATRRVRTRRRGPARRAIEDVFLDYFAAKGLADGADRVRRPLGLRAVHRLRASRPAVCSPARRGSRRRRRRRSTAVRPASRTTRATTAAATTWAT